MKKQSHSLFRRAYEKIILNNIAALLKKDPAALLYMLGFAIKKEAADFYRSFFITQPRHIEATIALAKKLKLNRSSNEVILDIGGGNGGMAVIFAKDFPDTQVLIFEPVKKNRENIHALLKANPQLKLIPKAVGSKSSTEKMFIGRNMHTSSFFEMKSDKESTKFSDNIEVTDFENVEVVRIDDAVSSSLSVSIMKMDIQGSELEALRGAEETLKRTAIVVLEVINHDHYTGAPRYNEIDSYLCSRGFELYDILPATYDDGKLKEWDVIYKNLSA